MSHAWGNAMELTEQFWWGFLAGATVWGFIITRIERHLERMKNSRG